MATDSNIVTFTAGGTIPIGALVKVSAARTVVVTAGNGEKAIGTAITAAASGGPVAVKCNQKPQRLIAAAAISAGASCYVGASGKAQVASATGQEYIALEAAAGDGSYFDAVRI